jgi:hypothetical protein
VKDVAPSSGAETGGQNVEENMLRRLLALVGLVFYGSLDRVSGLLFDDLDYPDERDPLASGEAGAEVTTDEDRGLVGRLLAS